MNNLDKKNHYNRLLAVYKNKLTDLERQDMIDYYYQDLSLSEIANNRNVSRNAVYLSIKQGEAKLDELESTLSLVQKLNKIIDELTKVSLKDNIDQIKKDLQNIIEEIENGIWITIWKIASDC